MPTTVKVLVVAGGGGGERIFRAVAVAHLIRKAPRGCERSINYQIGLLPGPSVIDVVTDGPTRGVGVHTLLDIENARNGRLGHVPVGACPGLLGFLAGKFLHQFLEADTMRSRLLSGGEKTSATAC